jgi:hypothetical protein
MVAVNKEQEVLTKDVACPECGRPIPLSTILLSGTNRYNRTTRSCLGGCLDCLRRYEVVEFLQNGKWLVHKYRYDEVLAAKKPPGDWIILNDLPEAPPVVLGPGGEYDKQIELNATFFNLLKALQNTLKCTGEILKQLLDLHATKGKAND